MDTPGDRGPDWPPLDAEWSQWDLHRWVRQMGINPDPQEEIPQGVKFIAWPQPPLTEKEIAFAQELQRKLDAGELKPLGVIRRRRDPKRN